jgi:SAM-dependent methyltransferase
LDGRCVTSDSLRIDSQVVAITTCRSCGGQRLRDVLSLGSTPIANALVDPLTAPEEDPIFPLTIVFCEACALVQLGHSLPAERIFGNEYPYYSSFSEAVCEHAAAHVRQLVSQRALGSSSLVVEVASNDGYLLRNVIAAGVKALGIDPSSGPATAAEKLGVPTVVGFFGREQALAMREEYGPADVIVANNVMAHVPDLNDFVEGFAALLGDDGVVTVENPYVRDLVEHVEFDTIYHEHYSYFSCSSVDALMTRHGLHLNDVEYFPELHGGTLRWHIGRDSARSRRCQELLEAERRAGLTGIDYYARFAERVRLCQDELTSLLDELGDAGRQVAAYGAAAKGATLLNSTGIGRDRIDFVVDRNVHKHGRLMPGCRLPIRPVDALIEDRPDDVLLLAWNFAEEIVAQQAAYLAAGGTFYVPVPRPHQLFAGS